MLTWIDDPDPARGHWSVTQPRFEVRGVRYQCSYGAGSSAERFLIKKSPRLVEAYVALLGRFPAGNVVELGISEGGSTALAAQVAGARKLVAVELSSEPVEALAGLVEREGLGASVRAYYGVDQADRDRLTGIVEAEFGDEPLDLVVDDASHLLEETTRSFEVLFPRLRPGGLFVIEDWNWQHLLAAGAGADEHDRDRPFEERLAEALADPGHPLHATALAGVAEALTSGAPSGPLPTWPWEGPPLTRLVMQLVLARAISGEVVAGITVDESWVCVERGPAALDPASFRVAPVGRDHFGLLGQTANN